MFLKSIFITERFLALLALYLLLTVPFLMSIESVLSQESGPTYLTIELFYRAVLFLVVCQVTLGGE